jgi:seryl-tRNA synthetase
VAELHAAVGEEAAFLEELFDHGLLLRTGAPGLYGRGPVFEDVRERFDALVTRVAAPAGAEPLRFPPLLPRRQLESAEYLKAFPHLAGTIFAFEGSEADAVEQAERAARHDDWSMYQSMTDLVLAPAACYAVYPAIAARGRLPAGGATVDTGDAWVFRHEPSGDPARQQMFHMREIVRIGEPPAVAAWRDRWRDRAVEILQRVGLDGELAVASDPFFGRPGRMLAASQRAQELKFEVCIAIASPEPTAVASSNYHQDHFGQTFAIELADGGVAHTACVAFGLERITLGLLRRHGLDPRRWPPAVRDELWGRGENGSAP